MIRSSTLAIAFCGLVLWGHAQSPYMLTLGGGSWTGEISLDLVDADGNVVLTSGATFGTAVMLDDGCYTIVMYDSYGDGWNGSVYTLHDATNAVVATGSLDGASSGDGLTIGSDQVCIAASDLGCSGMQVSVFVGGGFYDDEIGWSLLDESSAVVASGRAPETATFCVADGCYSLLMTDDYGDGWNGGSYIFTDQNGEVLHTGQLDTGSSGTDYFSFGMGSCPDAAALNYTPQDCKGAIVICDDETFGGNSDAYGIDQDLNTFNRGCLTLEHQSGWYVFSPLTPGTIGFTLTPSNGIDYDFAIWGPYGDVSCPPLEEPLRCSYSALYAPTGLEVGTAEADITEPPSGDAWVEAITVEASDVDKYYLMLIDNFTADATAFDFEWALDGVTLNCALVLPVELVGFSGTVGKDAHELTWETLTELNNAWFEVERSLNGTVWETVHRVSGQGNSTEPHSYAYHDHNRPHGTAYYRLRQVDFNGQFEYSEVVALRHLEHFRIGKVYPNPTSGDARMVLHSDHDLEATLSLYGAGGRLVQEQQVRCVEGATLLTVSTSRLPAGFYQLVLRDEQGLLLDRTPLQRR